MNLKKLDELIEQKRTELAELETAARVLKAHTFESSTPVPVPKERAKQRSRRRHIPRVCEECGTPFKAKHPSARFDTKLCTQRAWIKKRAKAQAAAAKAKPTVLVPGDPLKAGH